VDEIYLPLSRLLSLQVTATQSLFSATQRVTRATDAVMTPFILGIAGSVSVGKSTTARVLQALLSRWPGSLRVALITTDGFLLPNATLAERGLMARKGFPESYDTRGLLRFLSDIKAGRRRVEAPVYSHLSYDVVPGATVVLDEPDIVIVEGLNVLQPARLPPDGERVPFVSDFFDFSVKRSPLCVAPRDQFPFMRFRREKVVSGMATSKTTSLIVKVVFEPFRIASCISRTMG
jgi:type I pantothenate kinase